MRLGMNFGQWLGLVALVLGLYILWNIRQLLLLLFVAIVFATALNRLVRKLERIGIQRGTGALLSAGATLALIVLFGALIVPPFSAQLQELSQLVPLGLTQLERWIDGFLTWVPGGATQYVPGVEDLLNQLQPLAAGLANNFFRVFSGVFNVTLSTLFVVVLTIMLLINPLPYRQGFIRLIPSFYRRRFDEILTLCEQDLVGWITGTLINMVVIGFTSGVILSVLGVRLVLANALLAGLLEAIPNLGPFMSTVAPAAIALLDSPLKALLVIVAYIVMQQLEQFVLVPLVMGQQVSLLPAITLLAQIVFASFFGFLGLFLALPLAVIVRILVSEILIKDVLDQWYHSSEMATVLVSGNVEHSSSQPKAHAAAPFLHEPSTSEPRPPQTSAPEPTPPDEEKSTQHPDPRPDEFDS